MSLCLENPLPFRTRNHPTSQNRRLQTIRAGFFELAVNATPLTSPAPSPHSDRSRRQ